MDVDREDGINSRRPAPSFLPLLLLVVSAVALVAGAVSVVQLYQTHDLRAQLASSRQDAATLSSRVAESNETMQRELTDLRTRLAASEAQAQARLAEQNAAAAAQSAGKQRAAGTARRAANEQQAKIKALETQLAQVQQSSQQNSARIDSVTNDVSSVKGDLASTRSGLDQANGDMQRVRGDLGVMSGLIATNGKEIEELRRLGDRNIYEFTLNTNEGERKVGDILVKLEKVNVKRNRYSLVINADDKKIEKKDKTTNEPVQFYVVSKARQPYELVVNEVSKHTIKGYLATPKVTLTRQTASVQ